MATCTTQKHDRKNYHFTTVIRVIERTTDKHGQTLLLPKVGIDGWWTNLELPKAKIISPYENHGLSEQFHSEFKMDRNYSPPTITQGIYFVLLKPFEL